MGDDPMEEYLRPGRRRRRALAAAVLVGLTAAVAGAGWTRMEVPPSTPSVPAPVPLATVPEVPPPPAPPKARPKPRPRPAEPADPRGAPPTATLRVKPVSAE
jgi:hypothetical protein